MAFSLDERVDRKHGMLIVVDIQNDVGHRGGAAHSNSACIDTARGMLLRGLLLRPRGVKGLLVDSVGM